jgi:hypothetical protein
MLSLNSTSPNHHINFVLGFREVYHMLIAAFIDIWMCEWEVIEVDELGLVVLQCVPLSA